MTAVITELEGETELVARARLSIFGLGYVGCVSAACFAARGHRVIGVDANPQKVEFIRAGQTPVVEERIGEVIADEVASGRLTTTMDALDAILGTDVTMVCVGTPSASNGSLSTTYLERVTEDIAAALRVKTDYHVVVYRSTMVAGTCEDTLIPILEKVSGKKVGVDFGVCVNPEFLREGSSVQDFLNPPKTVVGQSDMRAGAIVVNLYDGLPGPRFVTDIKVAEMTKFVDNSFHALKVGFANEIGSVCAALGLDSHAVMDIFLADTKLNISTTYLRPGFSFGGSCLPKDVRALTHTARRNDVEVPVLANLMTSNETHLRRAVEHVLSHGRRRIGIFGLSFKAGTDDLRESPMVELTERLIGKGFDVRIHDKNVSLSQLMGANRAYIEERLPHVGHLLTEDPTAVIDHAEFIIVGTNDPDVAAVVEAQAPYETPILDLVRMPNTSVLQTRPGYRGIGW